MILFKVLLICYESIDSLNANISNNMKLRKIYIGDVYTLKFKVQDPKLDSD